MKEKMSEIIDCYINNTLDETGQHDVNYKISNDEQFALNVKLHKDIIRSIRREGVRGLLKREDEKIILRNKRVSIIKKIAPIISVAACIAMGIFFHIDKVNSDKYSYLAPALNAPIARGDVELDGIVELINNNEYDDALKEISHIKDNIPILFSETEEGQYEEHTNRVLLETLNWYCTIIKMKQGKWKIARKELLLIIESDGLFASEAKILLNKLDV